jgi:hypothetical protein
MTLRSRNNRQAMKQSIIVFCTLLIFVASCKKDPTLTPDVGYDYFPLTAGAYIIYDVDSTFYDDFYLPVKITNTKFQLKEKVASLFYDNQNRLTARIERYVKFYDSITPYSAMPWQLKNVWTANRTNTTAERVEENIRYVKLVFPLSLNTRWNTNAQNILPEEELNYSRINASDRIGTFAFTSALATTYRSEEAVLTQQKTSTEKYVTAIGLAYKQTQELYSQANPNATNTELQLFYAKPFAQRITSGYEYTWTINSYGNE